MWNKEALGSLQWLLYLTTFLYIAGVCRRLTMWSTILHWLFQACVLYWNCTNLRRRVWRYAGNHSAVNATMNNKKKIKRRSKSKSTANCTCTLTVSFWRAGLYCECSVFRLEVHNSPESECSQWYLLLSTSSGDWLWAIFPLWMWKRCKGISVNIWDSVIVSWNSFCLKWFFLTGMIWLASDCNK